jgi:hypothetical protein
LIAYIDVDSRLLETQKLRQIAEQEQIQYKQQAAAEAELIGVREKEARASMQGNVIQAELSIKIAEDKAKAAVVEAEGVKKSTIARADGDAYSIKEIGTANGLAAKAQADVLGLDGVVALRMVESLSSSSVPIVPEIYISGSSGGNNSSDGATLALITEVMRDIRRSAVPEVIKNSSDKDGTIVHSEENNPDYSGDNDY